MRMESDLPAWQIMRPLSLRFLAWQAFISLRRPFLLKAKPLISRPRVSVGFRTSKSDRESPHWKLSFVKPLSTKAWRHSGARAAWMSPVNFAVAPVVMRHSLVIFPFFEMFCEIWCMSWEAEDRFGLWESQLVSLPEAVQLCDAQSWSRLRYWAKQKYEVWYLDMNWWLASCDLNGGSRAGTRTSVGFLSIMLPMWI